MRDQSLQADNRYNSFQETKHLSFMRITIRKKHKAQNKLNHYNKNNVLDRLQEMFSLHRREVI